MLNSSCFLTHCLQDMALFNFFFGNIPWAVQQGNVFYDDFDINTHFLHFISLFVYRKKKRKYEKCVKNGIEWIECMCVYVRNGLKNEQESENLIKICRQLPSSADRIMAFWGSHLKACPKTTYKIIIIKYPSTAC